MNKFKDNWDGTHTRNIDGSGYEVSVNITTAKKILDFIKNEYKDVKIILDIGAGEGHLQKVFDEDGQYEVWSVEGSSEISFKADQTKRLLSDATIPFTEEFKDTFDLVTSFECAEHIHGEDQDNFWNNIFFCSKKALVTIHCMNEESDHHCFIRGEKYWCNYFKSKGIEYKIIGKPSKIWDVWPEAQFSLTFMLEKGAKNNV